MWSTTSAISRRTLIPGGAAFAGPFQGFVAGPAAARGGAHGGAAFRTLRPVADERDGQVRLHLREGFTYRSFHDAQSSVVLDDGTRLPGRHDGMGAFPGGGGNSVLVRNHEIPGAGAAFGPTTAGTYDPRAKGGCTTIEVSAHGEVRRAHTSLNGTMSNCSGGRMPWGAWVTCEETVNGPDVGPDFTHASNVSLTKPHGYVFEVPVDGVSGGQPITKAGRFSHEAVSFDPVDGALYLTEDNFAFPSGFYRYQPKNNPMKSGHLDNEGTLQMLAVKGAPNAHLEAGQRLRATYDVEWVDIADPDPEFPYTSRVPASTTNDQALVHVGDQGRARGAAGFSRLEGQVYDNGVVYFTSTQGGGAAMTGPDSSAGYGRGSGQIWAYHCRSQKLQLVFESPGPKVLDLPDNITTSPRGTLVVCEDNKDDNFVRGLSRGGQLWDIALNRLHSTSGAERFNDEFAGSTFSPDGNTLFVNIQANAGMTFAIWGPWGRIGV